MFIIISAIVTATFTGKFTYSNLRKERIWEFKAQYYTRIIESLYHIKKYLDYERDDYFDSEYHPTYGGTTEEEKNYKAWEKQRTEEKNNPNRKKHIIYTPIMCLVISGLVDLLVQDSDVPVHVQPHQHLLNL